jgi:uncharacterized protein YaaQ
MGMKLIAAMVQDEDVEDLLNALVEVGCRATKIQATGGFLRGSNNVVLIGVDANKVDTVLGVIRQHCHSRKQVVHPKDAPFLNEPVEVEIGGAVLFVWDVEKYERL